MTPRAASSDRRNLRGVPVPVRQAGNRHRRNPIRMRRAAGASRNHRLMGDTQRGSAEAFLGVTGTWSPGRTRSSRRPARPLRCAGSSGPEPMRSHGRGDGAAANHSDGPVERRARGSSVATAGVSVPEPDMASGSAPHHQVIHGDRRRGAHPTMETGESFGKEIVTLRARTKGPQHVYRTAVASIPRIARRVMDAIGLTRYPITSVRRLGRVSKGG